MIQFNRKDSRVQVKVSIDIPRSGNWTYTLDRTESDVPSAQLIVNRMDDVLSNKLKQIREDAYNAGWKDAKAKTKKQDWFAGYW